jgi:hypothetical protein
LLERATVSSRKRRSAGLDLLAFTNQSNVHHALDRDLL